MAWHKGVFLDRDGVINIERGTYTFRKEDFKLIPGVKEAIHLLSKNHFKIIVITNQSGISQGLYTKEMMEACHEKMLKETSYLIDDIYYAKWHPEISQSLFRKPDSLMLERAIAYHQIDVFQSWLVGDKERDIESAQKENLKTILVGSELAETKADYQEENLLKTVKNIILLPSLDFS